jgi:hypothetical protein
VAARPGSHTLSGIGCQPIDTLIAIIKLHARQKNLGLLPVASGIMETEIRVFERTGL